MSVHGCSEYTHGCRCDVCRSAKADYMRDRRAKARTDAQRHTTSSTGGRGNKYTAFGPGSTRFFASISNHGTRAGYEEHGCRCADCTAARMASDKKYASLVAARTTRETETP